MAKYEYLNKSGVYDYDSAVKWLAGARKTKGIERPLYQQGLRLKRVSDDEIVITGWSSSDMITYFSDGTIVLGNGSLLPWLWVRRVWMTFTKGVQVFSRNKIIYISSPADGVSPDNIKNCKPCDGYGKVDGLCWGPGKCEDKTCSINQHKQKLIDSGVYWHDAAVLSLTHVVHNDLCEHGKNKRHTLKRFRICSQCHGHGKFNYGARRIARPLTSKIVKFDKNLQYLNIDEWENNTICL